MNYVKVTFQRYMKFDTIFKECIIYLVLNYSKSKIMWEYIFINESTKSRSHLVPAFIYVPYRSRRVDSITLLLNLVVKVIRLVICLFRLTVNFIDAQ